MINVNVKPVPKPDVKPVGSSPAKIDGLNVKEIKFSGETVEFTLTIHKSLADKLSKAIEKLAEMMKCP